MSNLLKDGFDWSDIDALYAPGRELPKLTREDVEAALGYLTAHGCVNMGGGVVIQAPGTVDNAAALFRKNLFNMRHDTFKGPYIVQDSDSGIYYPKGMAAWTSGDIGSLR